MSTIAQERFFTAPQVAEIIGISRTQVYGLIAVGRIRATNISVGKLPRYRISETALKKFLYDASTGKRRTDF